MYKHQLNMDSSILYLYMQCNLAHHSPTGSQRFSVYISSLMTKIEIGKNYA